MGIPQRHQMPYRRKASPYWWISWTDASGQRRDCSSRTTDFRAAKRLENARRADSARPGGGTGQGHTIDAVLYEYLKAVPHERGAWAAKQLLGAWSTREIGAITPQDVADYKAGRGVSPSTLAKELGTLRAAIRYCQRELGWELPDPTAGRIPTKLPQRVRWLTRPEAARLLRRARRSRRAPYLADLILLGLHTGLRRGELLGLQWSRVDTDGKLLHLDPEHQKGRRHSTVPLNRTALMVLRRRLKWKEAHCPQSEWVFSGLRCARLASIRTSWSAAARDAGLADVTPHVLRHTCAAWLVQARIPLRTVAEVLRHRSIATTMRYAHLAPDAASSAVDVL